MQFIDSFTATTDWYDHIYITVNMKILILIFYSHFRGISGDFGVPCCRCSDEKCSTIDFDRLARRKFNENKNYNRLFFFLR